MWRSRRVKTAYVGLGAQWPERRLQQSEALAGVVAQSSVATLLEVWTQALTTRSQIIREMV
jgi:hypothetical protein